MRVGDPVVVLPEGVRTHVAGIDLAGTELDVATTGQSVALRLADDVDVARGELIASPADAPVPVTELDATLCWLAEAPLHPAARVLVKHGTRTVQARVSELVAKLDLDELAPVEADRLELKMCIRDRSCGDASSGIRAMPRPARFWTGSSPDTSPGSSALIPASRPGRRARCSPIVAISRGAGGQVVIPHPGHVRPLGTRRQAEFSFGIASFARTCTAEFGAGVSPTSPVPPSLGGRIA